MNLTLNSSASSTTKKLIISFLVGFLFFLILNLTPGIPGGDDGYRHVKFAQRLITNWPEVRQNGWHLLYLWPEVVDVWFLFHALLAPLTLILPLISALKVFTALCFGAIIFVFLKILEALDLKYHWLWLLLLGLGNLVFIFRISLGRPLMLAVLLLLTAVLCVIKRKKFLLLIVSSLFALGYSVFFLVLMVPGAYALAAGLKKSWRLLGYSALGVLAGVILNPFFPASVRFSFVQTFLPPIVGLQYNLPLGAELYPLYQPASGGIVLLNMAVIIGLWLVGVYWYIKKPELRKNQHTRFLFVLSLLTFLLTLKTQRSAEYFVPLAVLFCATLFTPLLVSVPWKTLAQNMAKRSKGHLRILLAIPAIFGLIMVAHLVIFIKDLREFSPTLFQGVSAYLQTHAPENAIIFNTQWDEYPQLFFWNSRNYYVLGLDPTFLFYLDQKKYWLWYHIASDELLTCPRPKCETNMKATQSIHQTLKADFNASYIILTNKRTPRLKSFLDSSPQFTKAYSDERVSLYAVR